MENRIPDEGRAEKWVLSLAKNSEDEDEDEDDDDDENKLLKISKIFTLFPNSWLSQWYKDSRVIYSNSNFPHTRFP